MIGNYIRVALRNIARHRLYNFINITCLTIGLSCAIFIILFVRDELSWDRWLPGSADLYRLSTTLHYPGRDPQHFAITAFPLLPAIQNRVPEVISATHIVPEDVTVAAGHRQFYETVQVVDPDFFQVMRLAFVEGRGQGVFAQPDTAVISQTRARKYFGDADPLGRIITVSGTVCPSPGADCRTYVHPLVVRGVIADLPHNSQLKADILFPTTSVADEMTAHGKQNWMFLSGFSYVRLAPGADAASVATRINATIDAAFDVRKIVHLNIRSSDFEHVRLTRFRDVHLSDERFSFDMTPAGDAETVTGIAAVAAFILMIVGFNYTNLAIAQAASRAREIALRKCLGARRRQIAFQFLGESVSLALLSLIPALSLVETLLPVYDRILNRPLHLDYRGDWTLILALVSLAALIGFLSGLYPAMVLSGLRPVTALRLKGLYGQRSGVLRNGLIALQFAVSIGLGIIAIATFSQNHLEQTLDLGFRHDNVLVINSGSGLPGSARDSFVQAISSLPSVSGIALSTTAPFANAVIANTHVHIPGGTQDFVVIPMSASPSYPGFYDMRLVAGRMLSDTRGADRFGAGNISNSGRNILVNESAARLFGFGTNHAPGQSIVLADGARVTIVGILADARVDGPARMVMPTLYFDDPARTSEISVRLRGGITPATMARIGAAWKVVAPESAMQTRILDQDFAAQSEDLQRRGLIFAAFVVIAILMACLGLFGIAAFAIGRRTREIGVRKAFGAKATDIFRLLMRQFSMPILIASLIAWPVTWIYLHHWLEQYPSRIELQPLYFVCASLAAFVIAGATVSAHAWRAARANPIRALRYE